YFDLLYATSTLFSIYCFLFNHHATTVFSTLSLHDALPISFFVRAIRHSRSRKLCGYGSNAKTFRSLGVPRPPNVRHSHNSSLGRSEEHTSELQSRGHLVCRLLLEKKKHEENIDVLIVADDY